MPCYRLKIGRSRGGNQTRYQTVLRQCSIGTLVSNHCIQPHSGLFECCGIIHLDWNGVLISILNPKTEKRIMSLRIVTAAGGGGGGGGGTIFFSSYVG